MAAYNLARESISRILILQQQLVELKAEFEKELPYSSGVAKVRITANLDIIEKAYSLSCDYMSSIAKAARYFSLEDLEKESKSTEDLLEKTITLKSEELELLKMTKKAERWQQQQMIEQKLDRVTTELEMMRQTFSNLFPDQRGTYDLFFPD